MSTREEHQLSHTAQEIDVILDSAVLYVDQTLTLEEQKQVRENIGIENYVALEMFGAVGDGKTDDTEAFREALKTGKTVWLGAKTYLIDVSGGKGITVKSTVIGQGSDKTTIKVKNDYARAALYLSGAGEFRNLRIFTETESGALVAAKDSDGAGIYNCTLEARPDWLKDADGKYIEIKDANGNLVKAARCKGTIWAETNNRNLTIKNVTSILYSTYGGALYIRENGIPVKIPVLDENGKPVLDENGKPTYSGFKPYASRILLYEIVHLKTQMVENKAQEVVTQRFVSSVVMML